MQRVLLVEDDASVSCVLQGILSQEGFVVESSLDGLEAMRAVERGSFDLVLLDVSLPGCSGLEVCKAIRKKGLRVPILMLTAHSTVEDKVRGFESGADDYLAKPFETRELLCRVRALLRRWSDPEWMPLATYSFGRVTVDFVRGQMLRDGTPVGVSPKELQLLRELIAHSDVVMSREELLRAVWGYESALTRTLDVHISSLRKKIEDTPEAPRYIQTARGEGYIFHAN